MGRFALLIVSASLLMRLEFFWGGCVGGGLDWMGWDFYLVDLDSYEDE